MRKIIAILFSITLIFALTGCGDKNITDVKKKNTSKNYVPIKTPPRSSGRRPATLRRVTLCTTPRNPAL